MEVLVHLETVILENDVFCGHLIDNIYDAPLEFLHICRLCFAVWTHCIRVSTAVASSVMVLFSGQLLLIN